MHSLIRYSLYICLLLLPCNRISAQQMHAILIGDVSPSTGFGDYVSAVSNDMLGMMMALEENLPKSRINLMFRKLEDDAHSSPQSILEIIRELKVRPNDTILFYFSGHGAVDDRGHYFSLAHGKLYRKDVLDLLSKKGARLTVLLTDCCNTRSDGYIHLAPYFEIPDRRQPTPLFQKLFFDTSGIVDINSSSPNESAFFAPLGKNEDAPFGSPGSIFTLAWLDWVSQEKQNKRSWEEMVRAVSLKVHKSFRDYYPKGASIAKGSPIQTDQNVYPYTYPGKPDNEGPRTGLIVRDFAGRGSVITEVAPGSPATQVYLARKDQFISLQPQQVVVAINGIPTPDTKTVVQQVNNSPQIMRMTIRDAKQGTFDILLRMKY